MKDNLSIVITMIVLVLLLIIFPLYNNFERQDDMSYNLVLKATTNFADEVINAGYLDQKMYNEFVDQLANTGNVYDIQLEAHKRILTDDPNNLTEKIEQYVIDYNKDIFTEEGIAATNINSKVLRNDVYYFNDGDKFYVRVKNANTTMAGAIFSTIVPTSKKERITANYGGVIKNVAWKKVDAIYQGINQGSNKPIITATPNVLSSYMATAGDTITFTAQINTSAWWRNVVKFVWNITDPYGAVISQDSPVVDGAASINVETTIPGEYKVTCYAVASDNVLSDTAIVSFRALVANTTQTPILNSSPDCTNVNNVTFGSTITFTADKNTSKWWKYVGKYVWTIVDPKGNKTTQEMSTNGGPVSMPVSINSNGVYNVSVVAYDIFGGKSEPANISFRTLAQDTTEMPVLTSTPDYKVKYAITNNVPVTFTAKGTINSWWNKVDKYVWTIVDPNGKVTNEVKSAVNGLSTMTIQTNIIGTYNVSVYAIEIHGGTSGIVNATFKVPKPEQVICLDKTSYEPKGEMIAGEMAGARIKSYYFRATEHTGYGVSSYRVEGYSPEMRTWYLIESGHGRVSIDIERVFAVPEYTMIRFVFNTETVLGNAWGEYSTMYNCVRYQFE